jgi:hypothetical protein
VIAGLGPHLDLLDLKGALLLFGLLQFFGQLVFIAAVIHNFADGRDGIGRNFHQVKTKAYSSLKGSGSRNDSNLVAFGIDQANLSGSDVPIDIGFTFAGSACLS